MIDTITLPLDEFDLHGFIDAYREFYRLRAGDELDPDASVMVVKRFGDASSPIFMWINDEDLSRTISVLNQVSPKRVLLSAHDRYDHASARFERELSAETTVLKAETTYVI